MVKKSVKSQKAGFEARRVELEKQLGQGVYSIAIPLDDEETEFICGYIKKPSRATLSAVTTMISQGRILEASELALETEWIEGDRRIIEDTDLFMTTHVTMSGLITVRNGELKKSLKTGA